MKAILYIFLFSFLGIGQFTTPAADTKKAASLEAAEPAKQITLKTKDEKKFVLPAALNNKFKLVTTSIEVEKENKVEVPLPSVMGEILEIILAGLFNKQAGKVIEDVSQIKKALAGLVTQANINEIYTAAEYLDIDKKDPFFKALATLYAKFIHEDLNKHEKEIAGLAKSRTVGKIAIQKELKAITEAQLLPNAKFYLQEIANQYFLNYEKDIDKLLGVKSKPTVQELIDHGFITEEFAKKFPELETDPDKLGNFKMTVGDLSEAKIAELEPQGYKPANAWQYLDPTPLTMALGKNDLKGIKAILKLGADINKLNYGQTLLSLAWQWNLVPTTEFLLLQGANPNREIPGHRTLLRWLVAQTDKNSFALMQILLKHGADPNLKFKDSELTPLAAARYYFGQLKGQPDRQDAYRKSEQLLIKYGAHE